MKKYFLFIALITTSISQAQYLETGMITGKLTDKTMNGAPLPFANVIIKGTTIGTVTDYNGFYTIENIEPGTYTLMFSFIGYKTITIPNVKVIGEKTTEISTALGTSAAALDEVVITTIAREDSEFAMLLNQKKAIVVKESIGAQELAKLGVSDAATATTKISGVTSSEASGDIFVRGLGDRYLSTTLNGLPIPSDDVNRKNIDLELFPTSVIQSLSISKTYSAQNYADQASGTINITTRELVGSQELSAGVEAGINTNVAREGVFNNFKVSPNMEDVSFGFYSTDLSLRQALSQQTWSPQQAEFPINHEYSFTVGKRFGEKFEFLFTGSQDISFEHRQGVFKTYRSNLLRGSITDAEFFSKTVNTTGFATLTYEFNENNTISATSLFINKLTDEVYEGGRNGEGYIYEETAPAEGLSQFIRDQNTKQTRLWINQFAGEHKVSDNNYLNWAMGINIVNANEPNRIRNEINFNDTIVQLGTIGAIQQRKSTQTIDDLGFNGLVEDNIVLIDTENQNLGVSIGANYRNKERDFASHFLGVEEQNTNTFNPSSIDEFSSIFKPKNFNEGLLEVNVRKPDSYTATLESTAGFLMVNYRFSRFNANAGLRFQNDDLNVAYNVGNIPGRTGSSQLTYENFYPSLNFKYELSDRSNLRLAASKTITLPEFKEISPFEYVSQTGEVTRGNPDLEASTNYNLDLKYEFYHTRGQLVSLTGFFKRIEDPINKVQDRGSAGVYSYFNTSEKAEIYGLELETKLGLLNAETASGIDLNLNLNATRMWHSQDLKEIRNEEGTFIRTFRYKGLTETGLQGASNWIFNGSLNFTTNTGNEFGASLIANYASDKIYALGAPEIQTESEIFYNDAIIEEGFVMLNVVLSKDFGEHWNIKFTGKNLLNPIIKRTQKIKPSTTNIETTETIRSYTRGAVLSLGINYNF